MFKVLPKKVWISTLIFITFSVVILFFGFSPLQIPSLVWAEGGGGGGGGGSYVPPTCDPSCANGGTCSYANNCSCKAGWTGAICDTPICDQSCGSNGTCTSPNTCTCQAGYVSYGGNACASINFNQTIGPYSMGNWGGTPVTIFSGRIQRCDFGWRCWNLTASLTVNYNLFLKKGNKILFDGDTVYPGDKINFIFNKDGEWWIVGTNTDSPPAYWGGTPRCAPQDIVSGANMYAPLTIQNPSTSLLGGSNINCSGNSCTVGNETETSISVTATINRTSFQQAVGATNLGGSECDLQNAYTGYIQPATKTWNFKVIPPPPPIPIITNPTSIGTDWCASPFQYIFNWKVNTTQLAKQIQVSTSSNFNSLIYDSGKITSDIATYALPVTGSGLEYNKTYYWRVKAWNTDDVPSNWSETKTFTTPKHAYPDASFTKSPANPKIGQVIQFTDTSTAYNSSIKNWSWTFQDGAPSSSISQNPSVVFNSAGKKDISLIVTDADGYSCLISGASSNVSTGSTKKNYNWTEVAPR